MNRLARHLLVAIAFAVFAWSCASSTAPSPGIMCPASMTVVSQGGGPLAVSYESALAAGGPGVTSTCTPPSGSTFPLGGTNVTCTATASGQNASCSFTITVAPPPRLDAARFLAFGDSITYGSLGSACPGASFVPSSADDFAADVRLLQQHVVGPGYSYPSVLESTLRSRYTSQLPVVSNEGAPGELATDRPALQRFLARLNEQRPEAVLLQEGINDLHMYGISAVSVVPTVLRTMAREARNRGARVFVATLLPEHPNGCRAYAIPPRGDVDLITPTNNLIRTMAAAEGLDLVDLYAAFQGRTGALIGPDGLHPNEAGYATVARTFLRAIQQKFESPPPTFGPVKSG